MNVEFLMNSLLGTGGCIDLGSNNNYGFCNIALCIVRETESGSFRTGLKRGSSTRRVTDYSIYNHHATHKGTPRTRTHRMERKFVGL